jgi:hypothetical protein
MAGVAGAHQRPIACLEKRRIPRLHRLLQALLGRRQQGGHELAHLDALLDDLRGHDVLNRFVHLAGVEVREVPVLRLAGEIQLLDVTLQEAHLLAQRVGLGLFERLDAFLEPEDAARSRHRAPQRDGGKNHRQHHEQCQLERFQ